MSGFSVMSGQRAKPVSKVTSKNGSVGLFGEPTACTCVVKVALRD
jgi:hypothetical protein